MKIGCILDAFWVYCDFGCILEDILGVFWMYHMCNLAVFWVYFGRILTAFRVLL